MYPDRQNKHILIDKHACIFHLYTQIDIDRQSCKPPCGANIIFRGESLMALYLEPCCIMHSKNSFSLGIKSLRHIVE